MKRELEMPVKGIGWPEIIEGFKVGDKRKYPEEKTRAIRNVISFNMKTKHPEWVYSTDTRTEPGSVWVERHEDLELK